MKTEIGIWWEKKSKIMLDWINSAHTAYHLFEPSHVNLKLYKKKKLDWLLFLMRKPAVDRLSQWFKKKIHLDLGFFIRKVYQQRKIRSLNKLQEIETSVLIDSKKPQHVCMVATGEKMVQEILLKKGVDP